MSYLRYVDLEKVFEGVTSNIETPIYIDWDDENNVMIPEAFNWVVTANVGYKIGTINPFAENPEIVRADIPIINIVDGVEQEPVYLFHLDETGTIASTDEYEKVSFDFSPYAEPFLRITCNAIPFADEVESYGSINAYAVNNKILDEFSAVRFVKYKDSDFDIGTNNAKVVETLDLGDYVHSIKRVYFDVNAELIPTTIKCANYDTKVEANGLVIPKIDLDFGEIVLPKYNNNISDYDNTEFEIFLPFVGFKSLSTDYIDTVIKLVYKIDIITGVAVIHLTSNNVLIELINCEPFADIIYRRSDELKGTIGKLDNNYNILYGLKPFIRAKWYEALENEIYFSDNRRERVEQLKGYVKLQDVEYNLISDEITFKEVEMLNSRLELGVLIK